MSEREIRNDERRKCAEELTSLVRAHVACAEEDDTSGELAAVHKAKAETIGYCARRLLDWMEGE